MTSRIELSTMCGMNSRRPSTLFAIIGLSVLAFTFSAACDWLWSQNVTLKRQLETVSRELRGQMFEVQRAREQRVELAELRFMAQSFETVDRDIYTTAKAAYKWGTMYGVSPDLIMAVANRESNFDPRAVSSAGAVGIMQVMPKVWADELSLDLYKLEDIDYNVQQGTLILKHYLDKNGGDVPRALFNYWGGNVDRHGYGYPAKVLGSKYFNHQEVVR